MKRLISGAFAVGLSLIALPLSASAGENPIFGGLKVQKLDNKAMKSFVGQNSTSAYYAYLGNYYAGVAIQYASYGAYLEVFGTTYRSNRDSNYYSAYSNASSAASYYYSAYLNN